MKEEYKLLPYRNNVGLIVFRDNKFLLVQLKEWLEGFWKFPQGGSNAGEKPEETALREFEEELGNRKIRILHKSKFKNVYDFPDDKIEEYGKRWRGQEQTFFVAEFTGDDKDIQPDPEEIKTYKWCSRKELKKHIFHEIPLFEGYYDFIIKVLKEFGI